MATQIELNHTFNAPRELVFKAFTEAEHLQRWWGPKGWTFHVTKADFRSGGILHYSQKPSDGEKMWVKFEYEEVIAPEKLVYISYFSDEEGNVRRAPFDNTWPMRIKNSFSFVERDGKTVLSMLGSPVAATEQELHTFEQSHDMFKEGFSGTFNQLDEYLLARSE